MRISKGREYNKSKKALVIDLFICFIPFTFPECVPMLASVSAKEPCHIVNKFQHVIHVTCLFYPATCAEFQYIRLVSEYPLTCFNHQQFLIFSIQFFFFFFKYNCVESGTILLFTSSSQQKTVDCVWHSVLNAAVTQTLCITWALLWCQRQAINDGQLQVMVSSTLMHRL